MWRLQERRSDPKAFLFSTVMSIAVESGCPMHYLLIRCGRFILEQRIHIAARRAQKKDMANVSTKIINVTIPSIASPQGVVRGPA